MPNPNIARSDILRSAIDALFAQPNKKTLKQGEALCILAQLDGRKNDNVVIGPAPTPRFGLETAPDGTPDDAVFHLPHFPRLLAAAKRVVPTLDISGADLPLALASKIECLEPGFTNPPFGTSRWIGGAISDQAFYTCCQGPFGMLVLQAITTVDNRPSASSIAHVANIAEVCSAIREHTASTGATLLLVPKRTPEEIEAQAFQHYGDTKREITRMLRDIGIDRPTAALMAQNCRFAELSEHGETGLTFGTSVHVVLNRTPDADSARWLPAAVVWHDSPDNQGPMLALGTGNTVEVLRRMGIDASGMTPVQASEACWATYQDLAVSNRETHPADEPRVSFWDSHASALDHLTRNYQDAVLGD